MKSFKNVFVAMLFSTISTTVFAQTNFSGEWNTGEQNTVVKIEPQNNIYSGKIVSSDNPKAEIGRVMVKDLKQIKGKWKGKIYAPKRKEWVDGDFTLKGNKLLIKISVGYFSKTIEWIKK